MLRLALLLLLAMTVSCDSDAKAVLSFINGTVSPMPLSWNESTPLAQWTKVRDRIVAEPEFRQGHATLQGRRPAP